jgi:hypothetical protein
MGHIKDSLELYKTVVIHSDHLSNNSTACFILNVTPTAKGQRSTHAPHSVQAEAFAGSMW